MHWSLISLFLFSHHYLMTIIQKVHMAKNGALDWCVKEKDISACVSSEL